MSSLQDQMDPAYHPRKTDLPLVDAVYAATLRRVREVLEDESTFRDQRVSSALQVMDGAPNAPDAVTVTIDHEDRVELSYMLRGRGDSDLKTKLLGALATLDQRRAAELRKEQDA